MEQYRYLYLTNNAVVRNAAGATMNLNSSISFIIYGTGSLENDGTLNFSLGKIDITTFRQVAGATFTLIIKGLVPGNDYGQIATQTAELNGASPMARSPHPYGCTQGIRAYLAYRTLRYAYRVVSRAGACF